MTKWSGVTPNTSPALGDYLMGVTSGNVDDRVTIQNLVNLILKNSLLSNPYKFSVYRTAALNSPASAFALLPMDTKVFDTGNNVDVTTNKGRFTAPIAGFYFFTARLEVAATSGNTTIALYKNGAEILQGSQTTAGADTGCVVSGLIQLAAGDYIEPFAFSATSAAYAVGSQQSLYFHGFLVSAT